MQDAAYAQALNDLAALAALTVDASIAIVARRERDSDTIESCVGCDLTGVTPAVLRIAAEFRDAGQDMLVIPDMSGDPRVPDSLLAGAPVPLRFFLLTPLRAASGVHLGTLFLVDTEPRTPDLKQLALLRGVRSRLVAELEWRAQAVTVAAQAGDALAAERRALQDSAAVYQMLIEQSGDGIVVVDAASGQIIDANESACLLLGYSRAELLQQRSTVFTVPDEQHDTMAALQQLEAGQRVIATRRVRRKDGSVFWAEVITKRTSDGRRQSVVRNVSERMRLEEERAAILERVTDAFMAVDPDGRFTWVNAKAAASFGRRVEDMIGRNMFEEFPKLSHAFRDACRQVMRDQLPVTIEDYVQRHDRWYENRIFPSRTGLSIFYSDITERKRAEAELNLSEARFRVLVEQGADVVFMLDREGRVTWVSPSIERVLGYSSADVKGRLAEHLLLPEDRDLVRRVVTAAHREPGRTAVAEFRVHHRDGSIRHIRGYGINRFDDPVFGAFVGSWHDITEQQEAQRVLVTSAEQLRRLTQRNQLVREEEQAHLSRELHDRLGQRLTMLKLGLSRVAASLAGAPSALVAEAMAGVAELVGEVDAAVTATRQISADLRPPLLDDFGLGAALEWAGQRFATRSGLACRVEVVDCDLPVDTARAMYAISQEALTNVLRHAKARSVTLRLQLGPAGVQLDVSDDGVGIPWSATSGESGSLGLLGMRERAAAVGATVVVYPGTQGGTTVSIRAAQAVTP